MSAYVLTKSQYDFICAFIRANPNSVFNGKFAHLTPNTVCDILLRENKRSVMHRYSHNPAIVAETGAIPEYRFAPPPYMAHVSVILDILREWDYNSCECDDYEETQAAAIWRSIARYAVNFTNDLGGA